MSYTKTNWQNGSTPALNAENLNHIEQGIFDAHSQIESLNQNKAFKAEVYTDLNDKVGSVAQFLDTDFALLCGHYAMLNIALTAQGNTSPVARIAEGYRPSHNVYVTPSSGGSSFTQLKAYVSTDGYVYVFTCGSGGPPSGAPQGTTATLFWKVEV